MAVKTGARRKLPVNQLIVISICRFAEPIQLTSILPYLPEMIESFGVAKDDVGYWAGIMSSVYSISQCLTGIAWGKLSDRLGRRPIILFCLFNTLLTSLMWGFSRSLPMALTARALAGLSNGNIGIARTMLAELCPWRELQPRVFSISPLIYNVGSVIGPIIGGTFANPYGRSPKESAGQRFLEKFPYAAPNIVAATFFVIGLATGFLYLKETLPARKHLQHRGLRIGVKISKRLQTLRAWIRWSISSVPEHEYEPLLKGRLTPSSAMSDEESIRSGALSARTSTRSTSRLVDTQIVLNLLAYTLLELHMAGFDQLLAVFLHHPRQNLHSSSVALPFKFRSGFSASSATTGYMFTIYGLANIVFQFILFPPAARKIGVLRSLKICSIMYPLILLLIPFSVLFDGETKYSVLLVLWLARGLAGSFSVPCITILLTNAASCSRSLGALNGVATSFSAIGRALGPIVAGNCFSLGVKRGYIILPFWILAAIALLAAIPVFFLAEDGRITRPNEYNEVDNLERHDDRTIGNGTWDRTYGSYGTFADDPTAKSGVTVEIMEVP